MLEENLNNLVMENKNGLFVMDSNVKSLSDNEMLEINGGILQTLGIIYGILAVAMPASYALGYALGKLTK